LQVPNYGSLTRRLTGAAWASLVFPQHTYFYTPATLASFLRRGGFEPLLTTTWDPWHGPGAVTSSAENAVRRAATGRVPWTDVLPEPTDETGPPSYRGRPRMARRIVNALARPAARIEAVLGLGAVVDMLARVR
jgi:hypothetical protein